MDCFGDASGHLRGVLQGDCEVYVAAVVAGDRIGCGRCPKRIVRRINNFSEAKWSNFEETQKRRLMDCFAENSHLRFGYAAFTRDQLETLTYAYLLYQGVDFPPAWDLALEGYAYGEILFELGAREDGRVQFEFDRIASRKQSEAVAEHVQHFVPQTRTFITGSRQSHGVQAADCLAGAVAEDFRSGTTWLDHLADHDVVECSHTSLIQLEKDLSNVRAEP